MLISKSKKSRVIFVAVLTVLVISSAFFVRALSKDIAMYEYNYKGENSNWTAEFIGYSKVRFYKQNDTTKFSHSDSGKLTVTYKGELSDLLDVKNIAYKFQHVGGGKGRDEGFDNKTFVWDASVTGNLGENEELTLIVNGNPETIIMKSLD